MEYSSIFLEMGMSILIHYLYYTLDFCAVQIMEAAKNLLSKLDNSKRPKNKTIQLETLIC